MFWDTTGPRSNLGLSVRACSVLLVWDSLTWRKKKLIIYCTQSLFVAWSINLCMFCVGVFIWKWNLLFLLSETLWGDKKHFMLVGRTPWNSLSSAPVKTTHLIQRALRSCFNVHVGKEISLGACGKTNVIRWAAKCFIFVFFFRPDGQLVWLRKEYFWLNVFNQLTISSLLVSADTSHDWLLGHFPHPSGELDQWPLTPLVNWTNIP